MKTKNQKMKWYKIWADHGGGHMGYSEFYAEYEDDNAAYSAMVEWVEEMFRNAVGHWKRIKKPPKEWVLKQISDSQHCIDELPRIEKMYKDRIEQLKKLL